MRAGHCCAFAALAFGATAAVAGVAGAGLLASADVAWPRWQGRLTLSGASSLRHADPMNVDAAGLKLSGASLVGDYYFARSLRGPGSGSGFRATSGLVLGPRSFSLLWAPPGVLSGRSLTVERRGIGLWGPGNRPDTAADPGTVPYVGVGYTGLAGKGGWGFSADLGVMALGPSSAVKLGRVFTGGQSLDDSLREMRLSPVLQLGVSHSF
jgi:hypothetical protein